MEKPKEYSPEEKEGLEKSRKEATEDLIKKGAGYIPGETRLHLTGEQLEDAHASMEKEFDSEDSALQKELDETRAELERLKERETEITERRSKIKKLST